jgi:hypothetical protein
MSIDPEVLKDLPASDALAVLAFQEALEKLPEPYKGRRGTTALWTDGYIAGRLASAPEALTQEEKLDE